MEEALKNEDCNGPRKNTPNVTSVDEDGSKMMSQRTKMHQTIALMDKNITMVGNIILKKSQDCA